MVTQLPCPDACCWTSRTTGVAGASASTGTSCQGTTDHPKNGGNRTLEGGQPGNPVGHDGVGGYGDSTRCRHNSPRIRLPTTTPSGRRAFRDHLLEGRAREPSRDLHHDAWKQLFTVPTDGGEPQTPAASGAQPSSGAACRERGQGRHHRGGNCHRGNCRDPGIRDIPCGTATSTPRGGVTVGRTLTRRRASARTACWWDFPSDRLHLRSRHRPRGPDLRREIVLAHAHDHRSGTSPECKCSLDR